MICIFGLQDPLRNGIKEAIATCREAGVTVRMCTGDNLDTAKAIAVDAGILNQSDIDEEGHKYAYMTGKQFEDLVIGTVNIPDEEHPEDREKDKLGLQNKKEFLEIKKHLRVLARAKPEHKRLLVIGLQ